MRLRQIAFVAEKLAPATEELCAVLGLAVAFRDDHVARWGLENIVAPIGGDFLEIVAPVKPDASAGRFLRRREGDGGYMVILHCADGIAERKRVMGLGIRSVATSDRPDWVTTHFHPSDTGGVLLSIGAQPGSDPREPMSPWSPAGPDWRKAVRTERVSELVAAELQSADPVAQTSLWARILNRPAVSTPGGDHEIRLERGRLRFVRAADGRGTGLGAIDVKAADPRRVLVEAEARGLKLSETQVLVCGTRVNLV
ncbi:MAG: VOC family protein [Candidatus Lambdaproteobacteria bacterium]|nr:VOC family protein [Candidatus Lambdaproteobacteria bacterium]